MNDITSLIQMIKGSNNPQNLLMNMIKQQSNVNPIMANAFQMMQNGNTKAIEQLARNVAKEKGVDIDALIQMIK